MTEPQVQLDQLGRGRRWAERAMEGEQIAMVDGDGDTVAWIVPATEPITEELIEWWVTRWPQLTDEQREQRRDELRGLARHGWRYMRAQDGFTEAAST